MKKFCSMHVCAIGGEKDKATIFNRDIGLIGKTLLNLGFYDKINLVFIKKEHYNTDFNFCGINVILKNGPSPKGKNLYKYLFKESKNIQLLHMYHICRFSLIGSIIYKIRNPKGKVYIKMDTPLFIENIDNRTQLKKIPTIFMILFLKLIDYIGFEDKKLQTFMINLYPKYKDKFILTTNGAVNIPYFIGNIEKENVISLIGRFGSKQKNNELLLKILKKFDINYIKGWEINLIGTYTDDFNKELNKLLTKKPELKNIIKKIGFLNKKKDLYTFLSKTKIVLHTANFEGDPNFQYDAMFCGCFMVSTNVANIKQNYPDKYSIFYNIKDEIGLYNSLKKGIEINNKLKLEDYLNIQNYCLENFTWEKSLKELTNKLGNSQ